MAYPKILTVQDVSCVGQCSLTVALPILSACGIETCVLPSAVLSTHTAGFTGYTFRDLTEDIPAIAAHWKKEGILFDAIYTGYLGSAEQIACVKDLISTALAPGGRVIVDPAMADNGKLYPAFDEAFVGEMKTLCAAADYVLPNVTEAAFLTGLPYRTAYDAAYTDALKDGLLALGAKNVVLTGIGYRPGKTGVFVFENGESRYYEHELLPNGCHGTGDVYASAFVGALMRGRDGYGAAKIAADYTVRCILATAKEENHWYGPKFETELPYLFSVLA